LGTVVDSSNVTPIEYVSISVLNQEGEVVTGGLTDAQG